MAGKTPVSRLATFAACGAIGILACAGGDNPVAPEGRSDGRPDTSTTSVATTTTVRGPLGSGEPVTFVFAGDVNFEGRIGSRLAADVSAVLPEVSDTLSSADLAMLNLETSISVGGSPQPKEFTFQAPPSALDALRLAGVDVVSEANNHGMDFGADGLQQSLQARADKQFAVIGIGQDIDDAFTPYRTEIKGQRITIIAATQVLDSSLITAWTAGPGKPGVASAKLVDRLVAEVQKARADSDTVIVFLHWGIEKTTCPSADQQSLASTLAGAGADIIVGSHAHRVLGGGRLGEAVVHYGLGNFAFYAGSPEGAETGIFRITATGRHIDAYEWLPGHINDRVPSLLEGAAAQAGLDHWNSSRMYRSDTVTETRR